MKEHFQDYGVRKWAGDDLIELQKESLDALQGLVEPYAPCIIKGCDVASVGNAYEVKAGLAALRGVDVDGQACVKIVRVEAFNTPTLPVYLSLAHDQLSRAYADGSSKVIANDYIAVLSAQASEDALELTAGGGKRLVDTIGITQKLDRVGGEAKDIIVSFVEAATRSNLENKSKLGVLIGQIRKWFSDLRTLAFKDKVAKSDLDAALTIELDNKVVKVAGKELSTNDLTDALLDRLNSVEKGANNYSLPDATTEKAGGVKLGSDTVQTVSMSGPYSASGKTYPVQRDSAGKMVVNVPWVNTVYSHPTTAGNKHIPAGGSNGQFLMWDALGTAKWADVRIPRVLAFGEYFYGKTEMFFGNVYLSALSTAIDAYIPELNGVVDNNKYPEILVTVNSRQLSEIVFVEPLPGPRFRVYARNFSSGELTSNCNFVFQVMY